MEHRGSTTARKAASPGRLAAALAATLCMGGAAWGHDSGVIGKGLVAKANTNGKQLLKSNQKDANVDFGAAGGAAALSGSLRAYYVDAPGNAATLFLPSPWLSLSASTAKFKNALAPAGPTPVKTASLKAGKAAKLLAKGLGGLDIAMPPGPNGVFVIFTIQNGNDATTHRLCTQYSTLLGGTVTHKVSASGNKLIVKRGVAAACPTCSDGVKNGDETDVDCGGSCGDCQPGKACNQAADCDSGVCTGGVCQAAQCNDGVQNGTESAVDCGGPSCPDCQPGQSCDDGGDCNSGVCSGNVCQTPKCNDGVRNGTETDTDCGGGTCPDCQIGDQCKVGSDCVTNVCGPPFFHGFGTCKTAECDDGVKNGAETDVDCGGGLCPLCDVGDMCFGGDDCVTGVCSGPSFIHFCQAPTCTDNVMNGNETDVDCGGGTCPKCDDFEKCWLDSDCVSNFCFDQPFPLCTPVSCSDGVKNGSESDVDCGGSCGDCGLGKDCNVNGDCQSNACAGGTCKCPNKSFTFTVNSNGGGVFDSAEWPGGTSTQSQSTGCSVTINRPDNNIDLVCSLAAPFKVKSFAGFSSCFGDGGSDGAGCEVTACPPLGIGSCCNNRPSCSAALNGSGQAKYHVQCLQ